jgi:hypothetical protein
MKQETTAEVRLNMLVREWETGGRVGGHDGGDLHGDGQAYSRQLEELLFHAKARFSGYEPFVDEEDDFPARAENWLKQVPNRRQQQALFLLLNRLIFIDRLQSRSLCRDAYRRLIVPWISSGAIGAHEMLSADYESKVKHALQRYRLYGLTESAGMTHFYSCNSLSGIPKARTLAEDLAMARQEIEQLPPDIDGLILVEDFVGTGRQAHRILAVVCETAPAHWRLLFVPLAIMHTGLKLISESPDLQRLKVEPVMCVGENACITPEAATQESSDEAIMRSVVTATAKRALEPLDQDDDPPKDAWGYESSGALFVTWHNVPNNTLPLVHHRAPDWNPLFRRLHHRKGK